MARSYAQFRKGSSGGKTCLISLVLGGSIVSVSGCSGAPTPTDVPAVDGSQDVAPGEGGSDASGDVAEAGPIACRDPAALASARRCLADEHCPCGAHCELGRCVATCRADSECMAEERCDRFGRCRPAADPSLTATPPATASGRAELSVRRVIIPSAGATTSFNVTARGAMGPVRVASDPGTEVRCDSTGMFAAECTITAMADGASRAVEVRASATRPMDTGSTDVRVYAGASIDVVAVEPPPAAPPAPRFAGVYSGTATLDGTSYDAASTTLNDVSTKLVLPIRASAFGTTADGTLRIEDLLRGLSADGVLVGAVTSAMSGSQLQIPAFVLHTGRLASGSPTELVATPSPAAMFVEQTAGASGSIQFDLTLRHDGNTQGSRSLYTRFRVQLSRVGDLPGGSTAPSVPAPVERTITTSGFVNTPWEDAALGVMGPFEDFAADSTVAGVVRSPLGEALNPSNNRSLATCRFDLSDAARELTARRWRDGTSTTPIDVTTYNIANELTPTTTNPTASLALVAAITPASTTPASFNQLSERAARLVASNYPPNTIPCEMNGGDDVLATRRRNVHGHEAVLLSHRRSMRRARRADGLRPRSRHEPREGAVLHRVAREHAARVAADGHESSALRRQRAARGHDALRKQRRDRRWLRPWRISLHPMRDEPVGSLGACHDRRADEHHGLRRAHRDAEVRRATAMRVAHASGRELAPDRLVDPQQPARSRGLLPRLARRARARRSSRA